MLSDLLYCMRAWPSDGKASVFSTNVQQGIYLVGTQCSNWPECVLILNKVFIWLDPLYDVSCMFRCISLRIIYITSQTWRATHSGWRHQGKRVSCTMALLTGSMKVWKLIYKYHRLPVIEISNSNYVYSLHFQILSKNQNQIKSLLLSHQVTGTLVQCMWMKFLCAQAILVYNYKK